MTKKSTILKAKAKEEERTYWSLAAELRFIEGLGDHRSKGFRFISLRQLIENYIEATAQRTEPWVHDAIAAAGKRLEGMRHD